MTISSNLSSLSIPDRGRPTARGSSHRPGAGPPCRGRPDRSPREPRGADRGAPRTFGFAPTRVASSAPAVDGCWPTVGEPERPRPPSERAAWGTAGRSPSGPVIGPRSPSHERAAAPPRRSGRRAATLRRPRHNRRRGPPRPRRAPACSVSPSTRDLPIPASPPTSTVRRHQIPRRERLVAEPELASRPTISGTDDPTSHNIDHTVPLACVRTTNRPGILPCFSIAEAVLTCSPAVDLRRSRGRWGFASIPAEAGQVRRLTLVMSWACRRHSASAGGRRTSSR